MNAAASVRVNCQDLFTFKSKNPTCSTYFDDPPPNQLNRQALRPKHETRTGKTRIDCMWQYLLGISHGFIWI